MGGAREASGKNEKLGTGILVMDDNENIHQDVDYKNPKSFKFHDGFFSVLRAVRNKFYIPLSA
jgi:hypothetical protein